MMLFAGVASATVEPLASGLVCAGSSCAEAGSGAELSAPELRLGGLIFRWSDAQLRFHRRDPRVEIGNLLLHAVQQRLLLIAQLFQLLLDTLALLDVG